MPTLGKKEEMKRESPFSIKESPESDVIETGAVIAS
jgi:hypothetical protein